MYLSLGYHDNNCFLVVFADRFDNVCRIGFDLFPATAIWLIADSPIKGYKNIMYSLHFYASEWAHNEYLPAKVAYARKKKLPIIVSEFGLSR